MERARELVVDWWIPVVLIGFLAFEITGDYLETDAAPTAVLVGLVPLFLLTGRRRHEPTFVAVGVAILVAVFMLGVQTDPGDQGPLSLFLAVLVTNFSLGLRSRSLPAALLVAAVLGAVQLLSALGGQRLDDVIPGALFMAGAYVVGRLIRRSRDEAASERERAVRTEAERERHVAEAAAAERSRIARELHDVIAHSLSLMVVQSSVEARVLGPDSSAAATLRAVEQQGRTALVELRRLLGFLREDEAALAPLPRLADLGSLLDKLRAAGHAATAETLGQVRDLPPGVELAAYRVLQEAVTNVAKHAPGSDVDVQLRYLAGEIRVAVTNGPAKSPRALDLEPGAGIAGMRERVRIYGGLLTADATADGGFEVVASIPEGAT